MKTNDGRDVSCAILVIADGGNGREGTAESTERLVIRCGAMAVRVRGDDYSAAHLLHGIDAVAVGCASQSPEERALRETARHRGIAVLPNPEVI